MYYLNYLNQRDENSSSLLATKSKSRGKVNRTTFAISLTEDQVYWNN